MDIKVKKWGNSLGFRIPYKISEAMGIDEDSIVELVAAEGVLTIKKKLKIATLDELIDSIPDDFEYPADIADFVQTEAVGQELI